MATYPAATALDLLSAAIALDAKPTLLPAQIDLLMLIASTVDDTGATVYTSAGLNRAASAGWNFKAGLTADQYEIGGGPGRTLKRAEWHDHCVAMAVRYATGDASVDGSNVTTRRGFGSIGLIGSLAVDPWS